ncbi:hypothetical protein [Streptomyces sp. AHA2]|uniref:hypothetical protein n=1 Tax=Streptomyces sp. AHA2 TaxID=3064526 RepID=UPI002FE1AEFD
MASLAWFQDGVGYGASELATWQALLQSRGTFRHLFRTAEEFRGTSDTVARTVAVAAGSVLVGSATGGATWAWSSGVTLNVPAASNLNPRKDLIIARLTTTAVEGANGLSIELLEGTPAAAPVAPARPDNAVALLVLDVPKSSATWTLTPVRTTGQYADQAALCDGFAAIDWAGVLPSASGFPTGFTLYDYGTNQRWVRRANQSWYTTDYGPWAAVSLLNFTVGSTNVTTSGELWARESSAAWEISGRVDFSPGFTPNGLVSSIGSVPSTISRPTAHTYTVVGQSYSSASGINAARLAYTTSGGLEMGADGGGTISALYVNAQLSKSPANT